MRNCIIGYSGFIGNKISERNHLKINSKNIHRIKNKNFNIVYCAAPTGKKFAVNKNPNNDFTNILNLIKILKTIKCKRFILISTIDIYQNKTTKINEKNFPKKNKIRNYGANRFYLEEFVKENFENYHIIRLPNLFGKNLKKNFIFDMLHNERVFISKNSLVQLFNIDKINFYIDKIVKKKIRIINLTSPPLKLINICKIIKTNNKIFSGKLYKYNVSSKHSSKFQKNSKYIISENEIIKDLLKFYKKNSSHKN